MSFTFELDIQIPGINPFLPVLILQDMVTVSNDWAREMRANARIYPKRLPNQQYVRTYRLGRGWKITGPALRGGDLITEVTNDVSYAAKVYGTNTGQGQRPIHQGRWLTVSMLAQSTQSLQARAQAALNARVQQATVTQHIRITP